MSYKTNAVSMLNPDVIAEAGDWHGNETWARKAINKAAKAGAKVIVQNGDFGIWLNSRDKLGFVSLCQNEAERLGIYIIFLDGNHEDFPLLYSHEADEDGLRRLAPRVWHLPRGYMWEWSGQTFMAFGGATSVDRPWRIPGYDWFEEEEVRPEHVDSAIQRWENAGRPKIHTLYTHETFSEVEVPSSRKIDGVSMAEQYRARETRDQLSRLVATVRPSRNVHGHWHINYTTTARIESGPFYVLVEGLGRDGDGYWDKNMSLETLPIQKPHS